MAKLSLNWLQWLMSTRPSSTIKTFWDIATLRVRGSESLIKFDSKLSSVLVFNAKPEEFEQCLKRQNAVQQDTFIKLRGLPFSCKSDDIEQFFQGKLKFLAQSTAVVHVS